MTLLSRFVGSSCDDEFLTGVCVVYLQDIHRNVGYERSTILKDTEQPTRSMHYLIYCLLYFSHSAKKFRFKQWRGKVGARPCKDSKRAPLFPIQGSSGPQAPNALNWHIIAFE